MYLKISHWKCSLHDWDDYYSNDNDNKQNCRFCEDCFFPLKLGVIEKYPFFEITEINAADIEVCHSGGGLASYGTFCREVSHVIPPADEIVRYKKEKISVNSSVQIYYGFCYSESETRDYFELELLDEPCSRKTWNMMRVQHEGCIITFQREDIAPGSRLSDIRRRPDNSEIPWLNIKIKEIYTEGLSVMFDNFNYIYHVKCDAPIRENGVTISLVSCIELFESDIENDFFRYEIDIDIWGNHEKDADAALAVAESIAEQTPEALEIIARYMDIADCLGAADARAWLADYYGTTDSKYDAYV